MSSAVKELEHCVRELNFRGVEINTNVFGLDLDDPILTHLPDLVIGGAKTDDLGPITVRHLLGMTTGLAMDGSYEAPPATKWMYNTPVYSQLSEILQISLHRALTRQQEPRPHRRVRVFRGGKDPQRALRSR